LVFAYTVLAGDRDAAGGITTAANAVSLSAGAILDLNGNPATLSTTAVAVNTNDWKLDAVPPTVSSVSLSSSAGTDNTYASGNIITVDVALSEAVTLVGTGVNAPFINLNVGGQIKSAYATSVQGSSTVRFSYTVVAGDTDTDGVSLAASAINVGEGSIKDAAGNNAAFAHSAVAASASTRSARNGDLTGNYIGYAVHTGAALAELEQLPAVARHQRVQKRVAPMGTAWFGDETRRLVRHDHAAVLMNDLEPDSLVGCWLWHARTLPLRPPSGTIAPCATSE
jgi:hypothetical protein